MIFDVKKKKNDIRRAKDLFLFSFFHFCTIVYNLKKKIEYDQYKKNYVYFKKKIVYIRRRCKSPKFMCTGSWAYDSPNW